MENTAPELRCGHCRRKLAQGHVLHLAIKCPRCRTLNHYTAPSQPPPHASERPTPPQGRS